MDLTSSSFPLPSLSGQLHCCWGNRDSWKRRNQPEKEKWNEEGGERKGTTIYIFIFHIWKHSDNKWFFHWHLRRRSLLALRMPVTTKHRLLKAKKSNIAKHIRHLFVKNGIFTTCFEFMCEDLLSYTSRNLKQLNFLHLFLCIKIVAHPNQNTKTWHICNKILERLRTD